MNIILTGDRPTGHLHIGHYAGSLQNRIALQNEGNFDKFYIMIADTQALTDNAGNVNKVKENIFNVAVDYLSAGIDPEKVCIFVQSLVPELCEMTMYFMNLVTVSRAERNPTVKEEIKQRGFKSSIPMGFLNYPISQASDILAFGTNLVPVGEDQLPMIEQTREIVQSFNNLYSPEGGVFTLPKPLLPQNEVCKRLPGLDGKLKMSKSAGNCIYLCDDSKTVREKVMSAYTDPNHIKITDKGSLDGNVVFVYLDAFCKDEHFTRFLPEYKNLQELKDHYTRGGLGDVKVKNFLYNILEEILAPMRERRAYFLEHGDFVREMLIKNSEFASKTAQKTLSKMKSAMGINYLNK